MLRRFEPCKPYSLSSSMKTLSTARLLALSTVGFGYSALFYSKIRPVFAAHFLPEKTNTMMEWCEYGRTLEDVDAEMCSQRKSMV